MGQIRPRFGGIGTVRCAPDSGLRGAFPDRRRCAGTGRSAYPRRLRPRPTALHLLKIYLYGYSTAFSGLLFLNREQPPPPSFDDSPPAAVAPHGWNARVAPREGGFDRRRYSVPVGLVTAPYVDEPCERRTGCPDRFSAAPLVPPYRRFRLRELPAPQVPRFPERQPDRRVKPPVPQPRASSSPTWRPSARSRARPARRSSPRAPFAAR